VKKTSSFNVHIPVKSFSICGNPWFHFPFVDSTNSWLLKNRHLLSEDGLVVTADEQLAGRGKGERIWECGGKGNNLICSMVIHPRLSKKLLPSVTLIFGLGIFDALTRLSIKGLSLKWPNDLLIKGMKVCGILCELVYLEEKPVVVAGFGLNIAGGKDQFSLGIQGKVTTIEEATGLKPDRFLVLEHIVHRTESLLEQTYSGQFHRLLNRWESLSCSMGKRLSFMEGGEPMTGVFMGLDSLGRVMVQMNDGKVMPVVSGEMME
jgi:BirA family biotin operon repressor/biotin-[acetyl-CoA-carboxylase] ligase